MTVEAAIYTLLKDAAGVSALAGTRIYPILAPQDSAYPLITYQRISGARWRTFDGPSGKAQPRFQLDVWATSYAGANALAKAVRDALDGYSGTVATVRIGGVALETDQDRIDTSTDPKLFGVTMDFMITHDE